VLADASSYAKVAFRLNPEKQRLLAEGDESVLDELRDQITSALFNVFCSASESGDRQPFKRRLQRSCRNNSHRRLGFSQQQRDARC
jgi:hypothetical protein